MQPDASAQQPLLSAPRIGVLLMLAGMFLFALNDAMGKWLVASYGIGQVLLIRSFAALVILAPFLWMYGPSRLLRLEQPKVQALRVVFSTAEVFCFYAAVRELPLADVMTYWLAAPIYVAALSPFLLGERVGPLRWAAIGIGFLGVLVALTPSGAVSPFATVTAMVGSLSFAMMVLTGRSLRATPATALVFWQLIGAGAAGLVLAPFEWVSPSGIDWTLLALLGVVAMGAHLCVNRALKLADAALVAPLQYTLLPWAIILGWLFFGDSPNTLMLTGGAIIIGAGLMLLVRQRRAAETP
jgi:drug/metabolite transporter (DMT)-like permease